MIWDDLGWCQYMSIQSDWLMPKPGTFQDTDRCAQRGLRAARMLSAGFDELSEAEMACWGNGVEDSTESTYWHITKIWMQWSGQRINIYYIYCNICLKLFFAKTLQVCRKFRFFDFDQVWQYQITLRWRAAKRLRHLPEAPEPHPLLQQAESGGWWPVSDSFWLGCSQKQTVDLGELSNKNNPVRCL